MTTRLWIAIAMAGAASAQPKIGCADLRALTGYEFTIATATDAAAAGDVPAHCRVTGLIQPEIRFEVVLPANWNRKLLMSGNGGYAGNSVDGPQRSGNSTRGLRLGYATAATNTGHEASVEPLGTFAVNQQKLLDYAFRSLHVTADAAKKIIAAYYGASPAKSYFEGCSTGGRQALILAQRFPNDFDGIIAGAPVLNFTGTMTSYACIAQALAAAPIPYAKLELVAKRVYETCDAKDGLADGLIDDPRRCDFAPARDLPRCAGAEAPDCFTAGQIAALEKIYSDVTGGGKRLFPGWPVGAEIAPPGGRSGWDGWFLRADGGKATQVAFSETFFSYLAYPKKDPEFKIASFNFSTDPQRLETIHNILDATDPDLSRFRDRGGKLIMFFGWADPALNPRMGVEYYESVLAKMGPATQQFFRLFMVPGMFHCAGGVGTSNFDMLTALESWVEKGSAPDSIPASHTQSGKVTRTRPLCPYPQTAQYKGSGSIDDAANFTCAARR
jgi:feruloyl esterase